MVIKALVIGDLHVRTGSVFQLDTFEKELKKVLAEKEPDFIVFLGDILHTHEKIHSVSMNRAHSIIDWVREYAPVYVLVGNHDYINNKQFLTTNHWMNGMKRWKRCETKRRVTIVDKVIHEEIGDFSFVFSPYVPNGQFKEALETIGDVWRWADTIFAHQEFKGCQMKAVKSETGDEWSDRLPHVVSGHIHGEQKMHGGKVFYTGACMQHNFGDSLNKFIYTLTYTAKNERYKIKKIMLDLPQKVIVDIHTVEEVKKVLTTLRENTKYKFVFKMSKEEFRAFTKTSLYKELLEKEVYIMFSPLSNNSNRGTGGVKGGETRSFIQILSELVEKESDEPTTDTLLLKSVFDDVTSDETTLDLFI